MIYNFDLEDAYKQCDIFKEIAFSCEDNNEYYAVLVNPACDLIIQEGRNRPKANYFIFLGIKPAKFIFDNILSSLRITKKQRNGEEVIDKDTFEEILSAFKQFINGILYPRYYYLPPLEGYFTHSVIDLQFIETKKYSPDLNLLSHKIASIKSSWKEAIPNRFTSYTSRIGVNNDYDQIIDSLLTDFKYNFNRIS